MKIDGKQIASEILKDLKERVEKLKEKGITPHLYIVTFGKNPQTESYLKQKLLRASQIGARITIKRFSLSVSAKKVKDFIESLNKDKKVHGIIIQRPLIKNLSEEEISQKVALDKDVDGFNPNSKFRVPVSLAVLKLLETAHPQNFNDWLKSQKICVIGKGITAGKPIANSLRKLGVQPLIIDSKTKNKKEILKNSDIIISAVGKPDVFRSFEIKNGAVLIGVGLHKETDGKFHGDFNEEKISNLASYYTPMPGGVGPVNVTMLMENLVKAAGNQVN